MRLILNLETVSRSIADPETGANPPDRRKGHRPDHAVVFESFPLALLGKGETVVGYQTGTIGPIVYNQDNSGTNADITTPINYKPEMFGAPAGSEIIVATVGQRVHISRGTASVQAFSSTPEGISFNVYTQAAGHSWFWGWHSGVISVSTTFQWYKKSDNALPGGEGLFSSEVPEGAFPETPPSFNDRATWRESDTL
jgi:hypothetical protein